MILYYRPLCPPACSARAHDLPSLGSLNAGLAAPPLAMGSESPEQRLGVLQIAGDVVIPQDDYLAGKRTELFRHRVHRPLAHLALIHDGERAEIANVRTAARGKQNSSRVIAPVKQVFPRHGSMFQTRGFRGTVLVAIPSGIKVAQELRPVGFGLTDN